MKGGVPVRLSLVAHGESETGGRDSEDETETRQGGPAGAAHAASHRPRGGCEKSGHDLEQGHAAPFVWLLSEAAFFIYCHVPGSRAPPAFQASKSFRVMKRGLMIKG